jgi:hypothetical protein
MLAALALTPLANARALSLNCGSPQGFQSHGRHLEVKAQGRWESLGFGHTLLNYELQFGIDCAANGSCWAAAQSSGEGVVANLDYRPSRYEDYQQFMLEPLASVQHGFLLLPKDPPEVAGPFRAYVMFDAVRGSFGATVPLLCQGEPVTSFSSSVSENALAELARADRIIQEDYGFPTLRLLANPEALQKEILGGSQDKVSVSQATQLAMAVILDNFDAIEAPLNIAAHGWASTHAKRLSDDLTLDQKAAARRFLREQMQNPGTSLALHLGSIIKGQDYPPEQGESTRDNWIFVLHVPTLSDHLYWVIVDRHGQKAPYLYGFN